MKRLRLLPPVADDPEGLKKLGKTRRAFREEIYQSLKTGRTYELDPHQKFTTAKPVKPKVERSLSLAQEYGLG